MLSLDFALSFFNPVPHLGEHIFAAILGFVVPILGWKRILAFKAGLMGLSFIINYPAIKGLIQFLEGITQSAIATLAQLPREEPVLVRYPDSLIFQVSITGLIVVMAYFNSIVETYIAYRILKKRNLVIY